MDRGERIILFHPSPYYRAVGNKMYGTQYHDHISETVRKAAEFCDSLQSFFVIHSMGGGEEGREKGRKNEGIMIGFGLGNVKVLGGRGGRDDG